MTRLSRFGGGLDVGPRFREDSAARAGGRFFERTPEEAAVSASDSGKADDAVALLRAGDDVRVKPFDRSRRRC